MPTLLLQLPGRTAVLPFSASLCADDVARRAASLTGVPAGSLAVWAGCRRLRGRAALPAAKSGDVWLRVTLAGGLAGGKGGFGTNLRSSGRRGRRTTDFGACRDLQGRRLRHVNQEKMLAAFHAAKAADAEAEVTFDDTPTGLRGWYLSLPKWADGFSSGRVRRSKKAARRKTKLCSAWLAARERRQAPPGAPIWWGCPVGRRCDWAHGIEDMEPAARRAAEKEAAEAKSRKRRAAEADYAAVAVDSGHMADAVAAGLLAARARKRRKVAKDAAKATMVLPVAAGGSSGSGGGKRGMRWLECDGCDADVTFAPRWDRADSAEQLYCLCQSCYDRSDEAQRRTLTAVAAGSIHLAAREMYALLMEDGIVPVVPPAMLGKAVAVEGAEEVKEEVEEVKQQPVAADVEESAKEASERELMAEKPPSPPPQPPAPAAVNLDDYASAEALHALGLDALKAALQARGMKCGGTLAQRADRLFAVRGVALDAIPAKLLAKKKKKKAAAAAVPAVWAM